MRLKFKRSQIRKKKVAKLEINLRHCILNIKLSFMKLSFHENFLECLQHRLFQAK